MSQFRERRVDPREYRGLSELREYPFCLGEMLEGKRTPFLDLVKQTENHLRAADMMSFGIELRILQSARHQSGNA